MKTFAFVLSTATLGLLLSACGGGGVAPATLARSQTLQFDSAPVLWLGQSVQLSARASSGLRVSFSSLSPAVCTVREDGAVSALTLGDCVVAANQAGNADYQPAPQLTQTLPVQSQGLAEQSIRFAEAPSLSVGGSASVKAVASSGLAVRYSSLSATVCSVDADSGLVLGLAPGLCTVAADQAGNSLYRAAPQAQQQFGVSQPSQATVPGAPGGLQAALGSTAGTVQIRIGAVASGGSPVTGYTVSSLPAGLSARGASSPLTLDCGGSCAGYRFVVSAHNALGEGAASEPVQVLTDYQVEAVFYEPQTQPNNSIFTGSFTLNSSTRSVSGLSGRLSESMTDSPMSTVPLSHQLVSQAERGAGGLLVGSFYLPSTDTFVEVHGNQGWRPGLASDARYHGYPGATNPGAGGVGNAYALVFINPDDPTVTPSPAQLQQTAYADCTALGMMGASCMTGTSLEAYGSVGTMGGYPLSQRITRR